MKNSMTSQKEEFKKMTISFLKIVRGVQSQENLNRLLNVDFNIVSRWERGQREFYWNDFLSLALVKGWNVRSALQRVTHFDYSEMPESHEIFEKIMIPSSQNLLKNEISLQKINRISAGKSKLLFCDFLLILERIYGRAEVFLDCFLDDNQRAAKESFFSSKTHLLNIFTQDPFSALIKASLQIEAYRMLPEHSDKFLADLFFVTEAQISSCLKQLEKAGLIEKKDNLFVTLNEKADSADTKDRIASRKIMNYFRHRIAALTENASQANPNIRSSYLFYPTHPKLEEQIFSLCRKFYIDLRNVISNEQDINYTDLSYIGIDLYNPLENKPDNKTD